MSYGVRTQCYSCALQKQCSDPQLLNGLVNQMNINPHQGSGNISLECIRFVSLTGVQRLPLVNDDYIVESDVGSGVCPDKGMKVKVICKTDAPSIDTSGNC